MSDHPLLRRLPQSPDCSNDELLAAFLDYVAEKKLELYPAQEEAILELFDDRNVILNTPTGSGKSLVALALHFRSLAKGRRSVYTCPIKALVNEKFLALCRDFGPDNVGMATGDATVNRNAPILCCTAEILANYALRDGAAAPFREVIIDEFHYYADKERGVAWQVPLLTMSGSRFLLMSATMGSTEFFQKELQRLTGVEAVIVASSERPVPLVLYPPPSISRAMIVEALDGAAAGALVRVPQPPEGVSYARKIDKAEAAIDWTQPAEAIARRVRAFDPFPGASFTLDGEVLKLWRAAPHPGLAGPPGQVLQADGGRLTVACGAGALDLLQLQRPGGRRIDAAAFLQARPGLAGRTLAG